MAASNNANPSVDKEHRSQTPSHSAPSTTSTFSAAHALAFHSPRRSPRLSARSPQVSPRTTDIHRTLSGGVTNSHTSNSTKSKRTSLIGRNGSQPNSPANSPRISRVTTNETYDTTALGISLSSDQSDDEEMNTGNSESVQMKSTGLATRSEIMTYFIQQLDGYECKLCHHVSSMRWCLKPFRLTLRINSRILENTMQTGTVNYL